jgi:hypothetical protein
MKSIKLENIFFLIICIGLLFCIGCEYEGPDEVWVEDESGATDPVILTIEPEDSAIAGDFLITLHGENFCEDIAGNIVTFANLDNFYQVIDSSKGKILEIIQAEVRNASPNSVTVYRPKILGDSCRIQISARDALHVCTFQSPYRVTSVSSEYAVLERGESINAVAMDKQENLYLYMADKTIQIITPEGERVFFSDADIASVTTMRMGPEGNLYITRQRNTGLYIVSPDSVASKLDDFPDKVISFDFDENGNIFAAGRESNLIIRNQDGIFKIVGDYEKFEITCLRIFNGYVYVKAEYRDELGRFAIWRSQIISSTGDIPLDVEAKECILEWSQSGADFSDSEIMDMTFSSLESGGDLLVATNNGAIEGDDSTDPILIIHMDGSFEPVYKGGLLAPEEGEPDANKLIWGNAEYIYVYNSTNLTISRLGMNRDGAPYYGREL